MLFTIIAGILMALTAETAHAAACNDLAVLFWTLVLVISSPAPGVVTSMLLKPELFESSEGRARAGRIVTIGAFAARVWILAAFAAVTWLAGWPVLVDRSLRLEGWVLVEKLARILPFLAMLLLAWMPAWRIDRILRPGGWSLREFLEFQVRQNLLLVLLPMVAIVAAGDSIRFLPGGAWLERTGVGDLLLLALMAGIFAIAPLALRFVWRTRRLEPGELRERLESLESRAGIHSRDLLVWETLGGNIANACVIGMTRRLRYVMVTDALMESLTSEEIESVFAHELGHVKRRHILWYLAMTMALAGLIAGLGEVPAFRAHAADPMGQLLSLGGAVLLAVSGLYWGLGFGWVSRRFELEADLYAVSLTGTETFVRALDEVARSSGRPRSAWGWRHFSIARRVEFLRACEIEPAYRERFLRRMRLLRLGLILLSALAAVALAFSLRSAFISPA